jgi:hypothetical protein
MVMTGLLTRRLSLDTPISRRQREAVPQDKPRPDPVPSPNHALIRRFWLIFRLLALLSIVIAAIAVFLVVRGSESTSIHVMIATALGVGLTVLLGTGLMTLVFLSSRAGHDEAAAPHVRADDDQ